MYLRQAGLTRNPTFSYLYCVRCRGQHVASEAPLERKYSRYRQCQKKITHMTADEYLKDILAYKKAEAITLDDWRLGWTTTI